MLNKVFLAGRLTKDPLIIYLQSGTPVVEFSLAYNRKFKNKEGELKEEAHFFDVRCMGKAFEELATRLNKGDLVLVEGELRQERWEKDGQRFSRVRVYAQKVKIVRRKKQNGEIKEEVQEVPENQEEIPKETPFEEGDDIPF